MAFFSGEYECKLDAKGRFVLPARLKSRLPEAGEQVLVFRKGFEPCLEVYPLPEWEKLFEKIAGLNQFVEEHRAFQRNFLRGTAEVEMDGNGRLLMPKNMARYAGLEKDLVVVGAANRMEIWNPERYDQYLMKDQEAFSQLAEKYLGNPQNPGEA